MKIFIDSADIQEILHAYNLGIVDGVTTNPTLIKKATQKYATTDLKSYIEQIFDIVKGDPVSLEIKGASAQEMYEQAMTLYSLFKTAKNTVVIKVPIDASVDTKSLHSSTDALTVVRKLSQKKIPTNVTLIFTPEQALLAAKAGATYVSPFVGREDDFIRLHLLKKNTKFNKDDYFIGSEDVSDNGIHSGLELVQNIVNIFSRYDIKTQVLAASLRNGRQVRDAALVGANVSTIPLSVITQLVSHPKTLEGMQQFISDFVPEYDVLFKKIKENNRK